MNNAPKLGVLDELTAVGGDLLPGLGSVNDVAFFSENADVKTGDTLGADQELVPVPPVLDLKVVPEILLIAELADLAGLLHVVGIACVLPLLERFPEGGLLLAQRENVPGCPFFVRHSEAL